MEKHIFYLVLAASEHWKALELSEALALNEIGYSENTFASFREWIVSVSQKT